MKKELIVDFSCFKGALFNTTECDIGLEYELISKYKFYNYPYIKIAKVKLLNYFYKETKDDYPYSDLLTFYTEKKIIQTLVKFKDVLDIFILKHIEPDFININIEPYKDWEFRIIIEYEE